MKDLQYLINQAIKYRSNTLHNIGGIKIRFQHYNDLGTPEKKKGFFNKVKSFFTWNKGIEEYAITHGSVFISGVVESGSRANKRHMVEIEIQNKFEVDPKILKNKKHKVMYIAKGVLGKDKILIDAIKGTDSVKVRCSCEDYYYTWWYYNNKVGSHFGRPMKPYHRKTPPPPAGRPYRNPDKAPGECKHIYGITKHLFSK